MRRIETEAIPVRIDKNVAQNIIGFGVQYGEDAILIRDIALYLCRLATNSTELKLFDTLVVNIDEFAKQLSYSACNLRSIKKDAKHVEVLTHRKEITKYRELEKTDHKYHIFETVFENALYRLLTEPFELPKESDYVMRRHNDKTDFFSVVSLSTIPIISKLKYSKVRSPKNRFKGIYECVLGSEFRLTLVQYFTQFSLKEMAKLRQPKADSLYIYVSSLKDTLASGGSNSTELNFNYLLKQSGIEIDPIKNCRLAKQKIIAKFRLLEQTDLGVSLDWRAAKDNRAKYIPVIIFDQSDNLTKEEVMIERRTFWFDRFCTEIINYLISTTNITIAGRDDAMLSVLKFIIKCKELRKKQVFSSTPIESVLKNSYQEVYGVPKSFEFEQKINIMVEGICECRSIGEIEAIFLNTNWYAKQQAEKRMKDARMRVGVSK